MPAQPAQPERWSHNLHYWRVIVAAIPPGSRSALDVGCGQGALTRRLRGLVPQVTGIDRDERSVGLARAHPGAGDISYLLGDFRATPLPAASFDLVTSVAAVHHMDAEAALRQMAGLLRPGGVLAVVGLARDSGPADLGRAVPAVLGSWAHRAASGWQHRGQLPPASTSPVSWPPPLTYRQVHRLACRVLPGARYRRHLYWRYSLVWARPGGARGDATGR